MPARHSLAIFSFLLLLNPGFAVAAGPTTAEVPFKQSGSTLVVSFTGGPLQFVLEGKSGNGWKPLAVQYGGRGIQTWGSRTSTKTGQGVVTFTMPRGYKRTQLRVVSSTAKFPIARLNGQRDFTGSTVPASNNITLTGTGNLAVAALAAGDATTAAKVAVTESDIWKVIGNQLFFFNQYRGLQIFDISDPANPVRTGSLRLAASGEQFYALDPSGSKLALIAKEAGDNGTYQEKSVIYILSVEAGVPSLITKLALPGSAVDSRLIGSRLYVTTFQWGLYTLDSLHSLTSSRITVQGFDLADPETPIAYTPLSLPGEWPSLYGNSDTLLVAANSSDWTRSNIHVIDISSANGQPALVKSLLAKGSVADKFKMNVADGVVSVVSNLWNWTQGWNQRTTWVETFPATGTSTAALAQLELEEARGESLHATRFDGDKLYVVTFRNVDPLFVVDLSDPAAPSVEGHVEIPGWSTYIEPYGDRLLAVGVEGSKVTVSLFDVADPSAPSLLSRVPLGNGSSWSEANYDEKAVGFFPDRGVIMVPYQTWGDQGWQSATAVLKVDPSAVTYQSSITHDFTARRAAFAGDNILSISGQELIVEDASDLQALERLSQLSLSWQVDRVVPFGSGHLIQIEDGEDNVGYWGWASLRIWSPSQRRETMLRISAAGFPDDLIEEIEMGPGRVIGSVAKDGRFYLGQFVRGSNGAADVIRTWIFDASAPPALPEISHVDTPITVESSRINFDNAQALWPNGSTLVWHLPAYAYYYGGPIFYYNITHTTTTLQPVAMSPVAASVSLSQSADNALQISPWMGSNSDLAAALCPVAVSSPQAPSALPMILIKGANGASVRTNGTSARASNGFLFASFQEDSRSQAKGRTVSEWNSRSWLQVIDFRTAATPVIRDRVSIPGELAAVSEVDDRGAVLLTADSNGSTFRACAYDGLSAYQMDVWTGSVPGPTFTADASGRIFVARSWDNPQVTSLGFDSASGRFLVAGTTSVPHSISEMIARDGILLISSYGKVSALPFSPNGVLQPPLTLNTSTNLWLQLSRAGTLPGTGAWFPAGAYGVEFLKIPAP